MAWAKVIKDGGALGTPSSGVGSNLTSLNGTNISSGTIPTTRTAAKCTDANADQTSANTCDTPNVTQTTVSGNAGTATILATSRNIAGNSFNGSSAITIDIEDLDNVTVSDSAAGGSPATGDIWIEY
jgi:hypothetical protein